MSDSCRSRVYDMHASLCVRQPIQNVFRFPRAARTRYVVVVVTTLVFCSFCYTSFRRDCCNISTETSTGRSLTLPHRSARSLDAPCRYRTRGRFYGVYWVFITMFPVAFPSAPTDHVYPGVHDTAVTAPTRPVGAVTFFLFLSRPKHYGDFEGANYFRSDSKTRVVHKWRRLSVNERTELYVLKYSVSNINNNIFWSRYALK